MQSLLRAAVSSISGVHFTIERVERSSETETRELKFNDSSSEKLLSLKFLEQKDFVCKTYNRNLLQLSYASFARRKHLNGFRRQKSFTMKACAEFYCRQIAEIFSLKFPLCITNLERLLQTSLLFFGPSPSAECLCSTSWFNPCSLKFANGGQARNLSSKRGRSQE